VIGTIHCREGKVSGSNAFFHCAEGVADTSLVSFGRFDELLKPGLVRPTGCGVARCGDAAYEKSLPENRLCNRTGAASER
jgi:hypothetical protein